ncbi:NXN protein, partial [Columbina picui]|nr:NXN protein [Columbina picui]
SLLQLKLWNKYRVSNVPSLIFIDAATGKVVCRNGLLVIRDDPEGKTGVLSARETRAHGCLFSSFLIALGGKETNNYCQLIKALYYFQHNIFCIIPARSYRSRALFPSHRSEDSFKQYFSEMPWVAVPYADEARRSRLNRLYGIQGIPTLIVLDPKGEVITRQGRVEVLNDVECREFPWHPKPVLELTDSNAVQLNEGPCLVLFVDSEDDGESEAAKQLIQPIAEKIIAKYKAKEEEA